MSQSRSTFVAVSALAFVLFGCPKKEEAAVDAGVAPAVTAETMATADAAAAATDETVPSKPGTGTGAGTGTGTGAGAKTDGGAAAGADASVATKDGGGPQDCCCEVAGKPLETLLMSVCNKDKKGKCVAQDKCEAAAKADAGAAKADAGAPQPCCCEKDGKKSVMGQSECTKGKAGKCVAKELCK